MEVTLHSKDSQTIIVSFIYCYNNDGSRNNNSKIKEKLQIIIFPALQLLQKPFCLQ